MSVSHPDEHKMLAAVRVACERCPRPLGAAGGATYEEEADASAAGPPIWENDVPHRPPFGGGRRLYYQNPDGSAKPLCAAPAGVDGEWDGEVCEAFAAREAAAAPRRPVLNPEEEDDSDDEESALRESPVPPIAAPEPTWVKGEWTEWEEAPEAEGRSYFAAVQRWRFRQVVKGGYQQRCAIQMESRGGTLTHIVCAEQVKMITNKGANGIHEVVIDTTKQKGHWNPTYLKFRFQKAENALAFQMSLVDFLSS